MLWLLYCRYPTPSFKNKITTHFSKHTAYMAAIQQKQSRSCFLKTRTSNFLIKSTYRVLSMQNIQLLAIFNIRTDWILCVYVLVETVLYMFLLNYVRLRCNQFKKTINSKPHRSAYLEGLNLFFSVFVSACVVSVHACVWFLAKKNFATQFTKKTLQKKNKIRHKIKNKQSN